MYSKETGIYISILVAFIVFAFLVIFFVITIVGYQKKMRKIRVQKITSDTNLLEKERARIAADLHDDLGGLIASVKLMLQGIRMKQPSTSNLTVEAEQQIDQIMNKLRAASYNLTPMVLQRKGLTAALEELIMKLNCNSAMKVRSSISVKDVKKESEIHIFRIIQEILSNAIRHSHATEVRLELRNVQNKIQLYIQDNGIGFIKQEIAKHAAGIGLLNIVSRVDILKAKMTLTTEKNKGVAFLINIPN